jgi:hypothetical protein
MRMYLLPFARAIWRIDEQVIMRIRISDELLKVTTLKACAAKELADDYKVLPLNCPPSILPSIANVELTVLIVPPHSFETGSIEVKGPRGFLD